MHALTKLLLPELLEALRQESADGIQSAVDALCADLLDADVADLILNLEHDEAARFFKALPPKQRAEVFDYLEPPDQETLVITLGDDTLGQVLTDMSTDERADLFKRLPKTRRERLFRVLAQAERNDVKRLLQFDEGTVGAEMSTDYSRVSPEMTASEAVEHLRHVAPERETIYVIYAVDDAGKLRGVLSLRELITAPASEKIEELMRDEVVSVRANAPATEAAEAIIRYDFLALPVVDEQGVLVGIVTQDDVLDLVEEQATHDAQKTGGMDALELPYFETGLFSMFRKRGIWLAVLFIGELFTASAMAAYEGVINHAVVLTLFLPLIISSGGNSGSQAASLVIRSLGTREIRLRDWWRVMARECGMGVALGLLLGAIGFIRVAVATPMFEAEYGAHWVRMALTIFLALIGVVFWGTLSGSMLPFVMKRLGVDPATSSTPFVATVVDVTGIVIYFSVAMLVLSGSIL